MRLKRCEKVERQIELAEVFCAFTDKNRIRILNALALQEETNAMKLAKDVKCKQSTLSHHLSFLVKKGLINVREIGKNTFYSINQKKLDELIAYIDRVAREYGFSWYKNHHEDYWKNVDLNIWEPRF